MREYDPDLESTSPALPGYTDLILECRAESEMLLRAGWRREAPCWWCDPLDAQVKVLVDVAVRMQNGRDQ